MTNPASDGRLDREAAQVGGLHHLSPAEIRSFSTIHANSAGQALARFTNCVLQADVGLPYPAVRALIAESVGLVVHLARLDGRRVVRELVRVERYDHVADRFMLVPEPG